jgi:hypothetical protein
MNYTLCECGHYKVILNAEGSDFWQRYWSTAQRRAPQLRMRKPGPNGLRGNLVKFCPLGLPAGVSLIHKFDHDCVDLRFDYFGHRLEQLDRIYGMHLGRYASIVRAGRAGAIRISSPNVNPQLPFEPQEPCVLAAILTAQEQLDWLKRLLWLHVVDHPGHRLV